MYIQNLNKPSINPENRCYYPNFINIETKINNSLEISLAISGGVLSMFYFIPLSKLLLQVNNFSRFKLLSLYNSHDSYTLILFGKLG